MHGVVLLHDMNGIVALCCLTRALCFACFTSQAEQQYQGDGARAAKKAKKRPGAMGETETETPSSDIKTTTRGSGPRFRLWRPFVAFDFISLLRGPLWRPLEPSAQASW